MHLPADVSLHRRHEVAKLRREQRQAAQAAQRQRAPGAASVAGGGPRCRCYGGGGAVATVVVVHVARLVHAAVRLFVARFNLNSEANFEKPGYITL